MKVRRPTPRGSAIGGMLGSLPPWVEMPQAATRAGNPMTTDETQEPESAERPRGLAGPIHLDYSATTPLDRHMLELSTGKDGTQTSPVAINALLETARRGLDRVDPADLAAETASGALIVDIRPIGQRQRDGDMPGALVIDRNVLEWRLDPTSPHHTPGMTDAGRRVIIVCNQGYSSSLAAATLRQLGLRLATDLTGGYQAWARCANQHPEAQAKS